VSAVIRGYLILDFGVNPITGITDDDSAKNKSSISQKVLIVKLVAYGKSP
jgi:hypothetical protein